MQQGSELLAQIASIAVQQLHLTTPQTFQQLDKVRARQN
jgi:hypothetical protein